MMGKEHVELEGVDAVQNAGDKFVSYHLSPL
jgi:hypothetical protein